MPTKIGKLTRSTVVKSDPVNICGPAKEQTGVDIRRSDDSGFSCKNQNSPENPENSAHSTAVRVYPTVVEPCSEAIVPTGKVQREDNSGFSCKYPKSLENLENGAHSTAVRVYPTAVEPCSEALVAPERFQREDNSTTARNYEKSGICMNASPSTEIARDRIVGQEFAPTNQLIDDLKHTCYYIPGKISSKSVQFLIDTGCTRSVLSKNMFDRMPLNIREKLQPNDLQGIMADGSILPMIGKITIPCTVRNEVFNETFIVSTITDDAILGVSFLKEKGCTLNCSKSVLCLNGKELPCVDKTGASLANHVQLIQNITIPTSSEIKTKARKADKEQLRDIGIIEILSINLRYPECKVTGSVCQLDKNNQVHSSCCNIKDDDFVIKTRASMGKHRVVDKPHIQKQDEPELTSSVPINKLTVASDDDCTQPPNLSHCLCEPATHSYCTKTDKMLIAKLLKENADGMGCIACAEHNEIKEPVMTTKTAMCFNTDSSLCFNDYNESMTRPVQTKSIYNLTQSQQAPSEPGKIYEGDKNNSRVSELTLKEGNLELKRWHWPGLKPNEKKVIRSCKICRVAKHNLHVNESQPIQTIIADREDNFITD